MGISKKKRKHNNNTRKQDHLHTIHDMVQPFAHHSRHGAAM